MFVSAEIRWFYQNECPARLRRWFHETNPAPGGGKLRIDEYLSQTNQSEISIKIRGQNSGVEIKGLVAICPNEGVPFAPSFELWCKWHLQESALEMSKKIIIRKVRWLRTYDMSGAAIAEIPLQADEQPLNGEPLPRQGCNVEITNIHVAESSSQWWTLSFEAFGGLDSAPRNLRKAAQFLILHSFPLPISGEFMNYPSWLAQFRS
jgi:hypothetical protein